MAVRQAAAFQTSRLRGEMLTRHMQPRNWKYRKKLLPIAAWSFTRFQTFIFLASSKWM